VDNLKEGLKRLGRKERVREERRGYMGLASQWEVVQPEHAPSGRREVGQPPLFPMPRVITNHKVP